MPKPNASSIDGGREFVGSFTGVAGDGSGYRGETALTDSEVGVFVFGLDTAGGSGVPKADGPIDGAFLLSPDKQFFLGYNLKTGAYFAAGK